MNEAAGLPAHNERVRENMEHSLPYHADQPFHPSLFRNFARIHHTLLTSRNMEVHMHIHIEV